MSLLKSKSPPIVYRKDFVRDKLETIVFVVVLVFLLKQFVVEAFVIPTGSMAETLYGYQKWITCGECGIDFALNSSCEVDPSDGRLRPVQGYCCPNCRYKHVFMDRSPRNDSGDRVLVHKAQYHKFAAKPGDVVVFKFPREPQKNYSAINYIKRMWGTGGQTIAIWRGDLYVTESLNCPEDALDESGAALYPRPGDPNDLWRLQYTYSNNAAAIKLFDESRAAGFPENGKGFTLIRKSDELVKAMQRLVYDNEHQAAFLKGKGVPPRWAGSGWTADADNKKFDHSTASLDWVRYRHLISDDWRGVASGKEIEPSPIDNFLGYNAETGMTPQGEYRLLLDNETGDHRFWVGDLSLDCRANLADANGEIILELSKGTDRFQARLTSDKVRLVRQKSQFQAAVEGGVRSLKPANGDGEELASAAIAFGPGEHHLQFSNIDCRLRLTIDGRNVSFGNAADYAPLMPSEFDPADTKKEGWTVANDLQAPVSIGARGNASVGKLKIFRDSFFLNENYKYSTHFSSTVHTYFVQPGHYLCLGDNSAQSSDGRVWGLVPERLLLGKASFIFFPFDRIGFIK